MILEIERDSKKCTIWNGYPKVSFLWVTNWYDGSIFSYLLICISLFCLQNRGPFQAIGKLYLKSPMVVSKFYKHTKQSQVWERSQNWLGRKALKDMQSTTIDGCLVGCNHKKLTLIWVHLYPPEFFLSDLPSWELIISYISIKLPFLSRQSLLKCSGGLAMHTKLLPE